MSYGGCSVYALNKFVEPLKWKRRASLIEKRGQSFSWKLQISSIHVYGGWSKCPPAGTAVMHSERAKSKKQADQLRWSAGHSPWSADQGSKGSRRNAGRPPQKGGLPDECNTTVWWKTRKCDPRERKTSFLARFKRVNKNY